MSNGTPFELRFGMLQLAAGMLQDKHPTEAEIFSLAEKCNLFVSTGNGAKITGTTMVENNHYNALLDKSGILAWLEVMVRDGFSFKILNVDNEFSVSYGNNADGNKFGKFINSYNELNLISYKSLIEAFNKAENFWRKERNKN